MRWAATSGHRHNPRQKPLLSVEEAAELLGQSRSSLYRAISRGDLPLPVVTNGRYRIPRLAVDRLLAGDPVVLGAAGAVSSA